MDCCGVQGNALEWGCVLLETPSNHASQVNQTIQGIVKNSLENFRNHYDSNTNGRVLLAVNWSEDAPYTQQEIDQAKEASQNAKDEANQHIKNAWEALGNYNPGTVVRESLNGWSSLRESEQYEREAVQMENSNIDHYTNREK